MTDLRGGDRRQAARRDIDRAVHYAEQNLLAAALAMEAVAYCDGGTSGCPYCQLTTAAATYRLAVEARDA